MHPVPAGHGQEMSGVVQGSRDFQSYDEAAGANRLSTEGRLLCARL
ncbi:hypothetical protein [Sphingobium sp.]